MRFAECPAGNEIKNYGWFGLLQSGKSSGLEALIEGIEPGAKLAPVEGTDLTWDIVIQAPPDLAEEPLPVQVAKSTVLYQTQFEDHIPLLQIG
jgi:hypothetical protein